MFRYLEWAKGEPYRSADEDVSAGGQVKFGRAAVVSVHDMDQVQRSGQGRESVKSPRGALTSPWPSRD